MRILKPYKGRYFSGRTSIFFAIIILLTFLISCSPASHLLKTDDRFSDKENFDQWMQFYYKNPKPELFYASFDFLNTHDFHPGAMEPLLVSFYGNLFRRHPNMVAVWVERVEAWNLKEGMGAILYGGLKVSNLEVGKDILNSRLEKASDSQRRTLQWAINLKPGVYSEIETPQWEGHLDSLWAVFFVTGEKEPVKKIISVLPYAPDPNKGEKIIGDPPEGPVLALTQKLTGAAALWSLLANSRQNPDVLNICKTEVETDRDQKIKEKLHWIIREVEKIE